MIDTEPAYDDLVRQPDGGALMVLGGETYVRGPAGYWWWGGDPRVGLHARLWEPTGPTSIAAALDRAAGLGPTLGEQLAAVGKEFVAALAPMLEYFRRLRAAAAEMWPIVLRSLLGPPPPRRVPRRVKPRQPRGTRRVDTAAARRMNTQRYHVARRAARHHRGDDR